MAELTKEGNLRKMLLSIVKANSYMQVFGDDERVLYQLFLNMPVVADASQKNSKIMVHAELVNYEPQKAKAHLEALMVKELETIACYL